MASLICPDCQAAVEVTEWSDSPVSCPQCGASIRKSADRDDGGIAPGLPPERGSRAIRGDDQSFDEHLDVKLRTNKWRYPVLGVRLIFWSVLVIAALQIVALSYQMVSPLSSDDPNLLQPMMLVLMVVGCGAMIGYITFLVGLVMCCLAPDPSARRSAIWSVVGLGIAILLGVAIVVAMIIQQFPAMQAQIAAQQKAAQQGAPPPPPPPQDPNAFWKMFLNGGLGVKVMGVATLAAIGLFYYKWMYIHVAVANAFNDRSLRFLGIVNLAAWPILLLLSAAVSLFAVRAFDGDVSTSLRIQAGSALIQYVVRSGLYLPLAWKTVKTIEAGT